MIAERGLRRLTFNKAELVERMRANRDRHRQVCEDALGGYRAQMVAELETGWGRRPKGIRNHLKRPGTVSPRLC